MTINDLAAFGANTQDGLQRCLNNEAFYLRMVKKASEDANFQKLYDAMAVGDLDAAFAAAHALKGVMGNLALTPIFAPASQLTEVLRARLQQDCMALVSAIRSAQAALAAICGTMDGRAADTRG